MSKPDPTDFQAKVYKALKAVPKGRVITYAGLARAIGCKSCQAVGGALKRNPFAPEVPCHRVVKSDLSLGGFYGQTEGPQIVKKKQLLVSEGVRFDAEGRVSIECVWTPALVSSKH
ncbi:MAG: MGMT family protein [Gammaproteobacteria bacterium]|nr:MGMT family protein [Gammaproteobacteria bacterium]